MKILSLILFLSLSLGALGQNPDTLGFTNKAEAKNLMVNKLKEGKWCEYYDPRTETTNYIIDGKRVKYTDQTNVSHNDSDETAICYRLATYKHGVYVGIVRTYSTRNGVLLSEIFYINGKKNGIEKCYYDNGKTMEESPYTNDKKNGIEKWYSKNGIIWIETPYKGGSINGIQKQYYEDGKIECEVPYKDSKANGIQKRYFENGKIEFETPFGDAAIKGFGKAYYESGKLSAEMTYVNGEIIATKNYDENGKEIK